MKGDVERRTTVRQRLRNSGNELVDQVNLLVDHATAKLKEKGRPHELLIVQDDLDRLPSEVARRLYFDHGDMLKQLRAHLIFTVPIAMVLAPWPIGTVFE